MKESSVSASRSQQAINQIIFSACFLSAVLFFILGCGGNNPPAHSVNDVATVSEQVSCEAMNPDSCVGGFGFAVDSQGNFTAGPSPTGKVVQGKITSDELASLKSSLSVILGTSSRGMTCKTIETIPGIGDTIKATFTDNTQENVFTIQSGQECFLGTATTGPTFGDFFHQLLNKYYPNPFPS
jgi:hypothetical protein